MKKYLLFIIPIILTLSLIACDFTSEEELSNSVESSSVVANSSTVVSESNTSKEESSSVSEDNNSVEEDVITNKTIENIPVAVVGESALNDNGYRVSSGFDMKVSVVVKGLSSYIANLTADDVTASVDVSGIKESGTIELLISYSVSENAEIVSTSANFANVKISKKTIADDPNTEVSIPPVENTGAYIAGGIVISGTRGMEQFGGNEASGQKTAAKLNEFKQAIDPNVNLYIMPIPIASAFYAPEEYPNSIQRHVDCFNGLKNALVDVKYVDVLGALSTHTEEGIYFRTDHHWQALGAYYAAQQFASVAGTSFDDLNSGFTVQSAEGVVGSLYGYSNDSVLKNNPDTMVWYIPTRAHTVTYYSKDKCTNPKTGLTLFGSNNGYTKFIYGDSYTTHIQTNVGNGRKLLVFKDSFGNALAPFLVGSFDEIYIADYREFDLNAKTFIEEKGITDVCFSMAAFSVAGSKRDNITRLLNN